MPDNIIGWDIGGAHVKAAVVDELGIVTRIIQRPCPLWKGLNELQLVIDHISNELALKSPRHAMTMTGELVDLFDNRNDGVRRIIETMAKIFDDQPLLIFAGKKGFISQDKVSDEYYGAIASANWLASAEFAAVKLEAGLFVDIGSTTTDIIILNSSEVQAEGLTDFQRLCTQELIYTGIVRTPVMAVTPTAVFKGKEAGLMAEYFATMADVYRLTGELVEEYDQMPAADEGDKTPESSARRLSRMVGCDYEKADLNDWKQFAAFIREKQLEKIRQGCEEQLSRGLVSRPGVFIGAGVGRFLVKELAGKMGFSYMDFTELFFHRLRGSGITIADCAPAASVACLAWQDGFAK